MSAYVYASWPRLSFVAESRGRPAIAAEVRAAIRAGEYRPGHQLPSARVLADQFGVARGTVGAAMDQLVREGLVESRPRTGWFVAERTAPIQIERATREHAKAVDRIEAAPAGKDDADRLGVPVGSPLLVVTRTPLVDGVEDPARSERLVVASTQLIYEV